MSGLIAFSEEGGGKREEGRGVHLVGGEEGGEKREEGRGVHLVRVVRRVEREEHATQALQLQVGVEAGTRLPHRTARPPATAGRGVVLRASLAPVLLAADVAVVRAACVAAAEAVEVSLTVPEVPQRGGVRGGGGGAEKAAAAARGGGGPSPGR